MAEERPERRGYQPPFFVQKTFRIIGYSCLIGWSALSLLVILWCISTYDDYTGDPMMRLSSSCQQGFAAAVAALMLPPFLLILAYRLWRWRQNTNLILAGFCALMSLALIGGIALVEAADIEQPESCN